MKIYRIQIKSCSDWFTVKILGEGHWHIAREVEIGLWCDKAIGMSLGKKEVKVNKKTQFDETPVSMAIPICTDLNKVNIRICKGDIRYVEVSAKNSKVRNDINRPNDPLNCIEGTLDLGHCHCHCD